MVNRKSFVIHIDSLNVLDDLTDEQAGRLFRAIKSYHDGTEIELDAITKIAMSPFKSQFLRDSESYEKKVKINKINGLKGGRPRKQDESSESQKTQSVLDKAKKADSDSDSDSDIKKTSRRFAPPRVEEIHEYMREREFDSRFEAEKFFDFYESKGWMVGKSKMKDWKAAVRNWLKGKTPPKPKPKQEESAEFSGFNADEYFLRGHFDEL